MNLTFDDIYLEDAVVVAGQLEGSGPLKAYFDSVDECKDCCFENSEIDLLSKAMDMLFEKTECTCDQIDLAIGGELSNQLATTSYTLRKLPISLIGIYSACSTIALGLITAGLSLSQSSVRRVLVFTSSHNQSAERQFRNPVEYGGAKEDTQTFTATIGAACFLSHEKSPIRLSSVTVGKVVDVGFTDSMDYGRAMMPAALETLLEHFKTTATTPADYDLVLTGDLSRFGSKLVQQELEKEFGPVCNYQDCGLMLYDIDRQDVLAGGSGPGTSAAVLLSYVRKKMTEGAFKRVLLCATGALMNPTMINQENSIPCIAHAVELRITE